MTRFIFTLYVAGDSPRSQEAIANLRHICDVLVGGRPECMVVDVLSDPDLAERERILTTPTLVRETPPPSRRVTGDLSNHALVLLRLGVSALPGMSPSGESR